MRKVQVESSKHINNGKEFKGEALFHSWGVMYEDNSDGQIGNFTVAIVEDKDGQVWNVHPEDVKFIKPLNL